MFSHSLSMELVSTEFFRLRAMKQWTKLSEYSVLHFGTFRARFQIQGRCQRPAGVLLVSFDAACGYILFSPSKLTKRRLTMPPAQCCKASARKA